MTVRLNLVLDEIIDRNRDNLQDAIDARQAEMAGNNLEHYMIYQLLGLSQDEGHNVDVYQNIGRFVYKYAGALIEEATIAILSETKEGGSIRIVNTITNNPGNFQIDFFSREDNKAHEIKWRDATTDGDHVRKEDNKIRCIVAAGMIPVRIMYFMPNRRQAIRIQNRVTDKYRVYGEAHIGADAWSYIHEYTGFDLYNYFQNRINAE